MALKQQIDSDLKKAMLDGDKTLVTILRGLKSTILYAEVAQGVKDKGLSDEEIVRVLAKESKKRLESADLYEKGGDSGRQKAELDEKNVIDAYLPEQLSEDDVAKEVKNVITSMGEVSQQNLGQIIGQVKQNLGPSADGSVIAKIVKEKL